MPRDVFHLRDIRASSVRLYCPECHRWAQFRTTGLLEKFGPDHDLPSLLGKLKPCDRVPGQIGQAACQLAYWDRMTSDRRQEALAKGGLPVGWTAD